MEFPTGAPDSAAADMMALPLLLLLASTIHEAPKPPIPRFADVVVVAVALVVAVVVRGKDTVEVEP